MDYEKRYKEVLKKAKDIQYDGLSCQQPVRSIIEYLFPELKEDERIKNCIRECLANADEQRFDDYNTSLEDCLAWIDNHEVKEEEEKVDNANDSESKTKLTPIFRVKYNDRIYGVRDLSGDVVFEIEDEPNHLIFVELEECEIIRDGYGIKENGSLYPTKPATFSEKESDCEHAGCHINDTGRLCHKNQSKVPSEKCSTKCPEYSKKEPVDKIEPKFKVGDWISKADSTHSYRVTSLNDESHDYIVVTQDNEVGKIPYYFDNGQGHLCSYHPWTINDVRDCDIIAMTAFDGGTWIGMFKEKRTDNLFSSYCFVSTVGEFKLYGYEHMFGEDVHPATKEQKDILFEKMKEAGYKWDPVYKKVINIKTD